MSEKPFILDFDSNEHAVLEPNHDKLPFKFHEKLVYAFVPKEDIDNFLKQVPHKILGNFDTMSFQPNIYEIEINGEKLTLCQAPLGAPAATQLLDWLIAYGVKKVLAFGNAGALIDLPENEMFLPVRAIRGEGTSFYYQEPGQFIDMKSDYLNEIEKIITDMKLDYDEITTWTTDGFFRETPDRVKQFRELGATTVEMECAGMAACALFRKIDFAQILFTADTLADIDNYDERDWGSDSHSAGLTYGKDDFDLDRYQEIRDISAEMMAYKSDLPLQKVKDLFCNEIGYQTPKLGTRAAIFKDNKILLVQENDGSWSLPGGWCEVNMSVKENCIKEAKEESGLDIEVERVIGIYDQNKHSEAIYPYNVVHVFFLCKPLGGEFKKNIETTTRKYFAYDQLPENLSTDRNSLDEIEACFKAYKDPGFQVECD